MKLWSKLIILIILITTLSACHKDPPIYPDGVTPVKTGGDGGTYQPLSKNSFWVYGTIIEGKEATSTTTLNGNTKTFNGKVYYEAESEAPYYEGKELSYYYAKDHVYILKGNTLFEDIDVELEYLNDSEPVDYSWTRDMTIDGEPARIIGTIKEKNITKTVDGKPYKNVIHTTLQLQYKLISDFETMATYDFYVAKDIGVIQIDSEIGVFGFTYQQSNYLKQYSIK